MLIHKLSPPKAVYINRDGSPILGGYNLSKCIVASATTLNQSRDTADALSSNCGQTGMDVTLEWFRIQLLWICDMST